MMMIEWQCGLAVVFQIYIFTPTFHQKSNKAFIDSVPLVHLQFIEAKVITKSPPSVVHRKFSLICSHETTKCKTCSLWNMQRRHENSQTTADVVAPNKIYGKINHNEIPKTTYACFDNYLNSASTCFSLKLM